MYEFVAMIMSCSVLPVSGIHACIVIVSLVVVNLKFASTWLDAGPAKRKAKAKNNNR